MGKRQKHKKTSHIKEPRGQPFPSMLPQGCKEKTRQYDKDRHKTQKGSTKEAPPWKLSVIYFLPKGLN